MIILRRVEAASSKPWCWHAIDYMKEMSLEGKAKTPQDALNAALDALVLLEECETWDDRNRAQETIVRLYG